MKVHRLGSCSMHDYDLLSWKKIIEFRSGMWINYVASFAKTKDHYDLRSDVSNLSWHRNSSLLDSWSIYSSTAMLAKMPVQAVKAGVSTVLEPTTIPQLLDIRWKYEIVASIYYQLSAITVTDNMSMSFTFGFKNITSPQTFQSKAAKWLSHCSFDI